MDLDRERVKTFHPCFSHDAHYRYGRLHLSVAPDCNIRCRYCSRLFDCPNEARPGVTSSLLSPEEAIDRVEYVIAIDPRIKVIGLAGPGDPLANEATFETMEIVHKRFPELMICISTNGLLLSEHLSRLIASGLSALTVTVNAIFPEIGERIYSYISYKNKTYIGKEAAEILYLRQREGIKEAVKMGITVKSNTVLIPGINDRHIEDIAKEMKGIDVSLMNIVGVIPEGDLRSIRPPSSYDVARTRKRCGSIINQMSHCRQCRADAAGLLGDDRLIKEIYPTIEKIGSEYG